MGYVYEDYFKEVSYMSPGDVETSLLRPTHTLKDFLYLYDSYPKNMWRKTTLTGEGKTDTYYLSMNDLILSIKPAELFTTVSSPYLKDVVTINKPYEKCSRVLEITMILSFLFSEIEIEGGILDDVIDTIDISDGCEDDHML